MRKFCFTFLLVGTFTFTYGQKIPSLGVNKVRITEPGRSIVVEINPAGDPGTESDRMYYWYSGNALHTTQGGYSGKLLNGYYQEYYTNKNLKEQGTFKKGLKDGKWYNWNENGLLTETLTWKKGIKHGAFVRYDEQGHISQTGLYDDNLIDGKVLIYHGKDSVETVKYKDGQIINNKISSPTLLQKLKAWKQRQQEKRKIKGAQPKDNRQPMKNQRIMQ